MAGALRRGATRRRYHRRPAQRIDGLSRCELQQDFAAAPARRRGRIAGRRLRASPAACRTRRFGVYRNNVYSSLIDVLQARFPVVSRLVGEEFFRAMARVYVEQEPPRSAVLLRYGASFPDFVASFAPAAIGALSRRHGRARMGLARGLSRRRCRTAPARGTRLCRRSCGRRRAQAPSLARRGELSLSDRDDLRAARRGASPRRDSSREAKMRWRAARSRGRDQKAADGCGDVHRNARAERALERLRQAPRDARPASTSKPISRG